MKWKQLQVQNLKYIAAKELSHSTVTNTAKRCVSWHTQGPRPGNSTKSLRPCERPARSVQSWSPERGCSKGWALQQRRHVNQHSLADKTWNAAYPSCQIRLDGKKTGRGNPSSNLVLIHVELYNWQPAHWIESGSLQANKAVLVLHVLNNQHNLLPVLPYSAAVKLPNALRGQFHVKPIAIDQVGGQKHIIDNEQGLQMEEWIQLMQNLKVYKSPPSHKQKL